MDSAAVINRLKEKPDLNVLVEEVIANPEILGHLIAIVLTDPTSIKYTCTKIIRKVSEQKPELVYPYFDDISKWLKHKNSFIKWDSIQTLANLVRVDQEHKFDEVYQDYFALIHDAQMITAANVIGNAWKIVLAKPEWESDITNRLLEVPQIIYLNKGNPSPECNNIACAHVLECFEHYFAESSNQQAILAFAKSQQDNSRNAVAKKAAKFVKNHAE